MAKNKTDETEKVTILDFVIPEKIDAFCREYTFVGKFQEGCTMYNDSKLREFFKAYVCPHGDPLQWYVSQLAERGYYLTVDILPEPAIYVM